MKKYSWLLIMICAVCFFSLGFTEVSAAEYESLTYTVSNNKAKITDCDESVTVIEIPEKIGEYPVTEIGSSAFENCANLTSITFPKTIIKSGTNAFEGCEKLNRVNITDMEAWCKIDFNDVGANPLGYAENLYLNDILVEDLVIPENITIIKESSFANCRSLKSVTFHSNLTQINNYAFAMCTNLKSVAMMDGNVSTKIGSSVFEQCENLTDVRISNNVTQIGQNAFTNCKKLTKITIPDSVTTISSGAFSSCTGLKTVNIGSGLSTISGSSFHSCEQLEYISLPVELTTINSYAFSGCVNIEKVFYAGNEAQWNSITINNTNNGNKYLTNAEIVYNATVRTYKFETNCDEVLPDITDYAVFKAPVLNDPEGTFEGWYDNKDLKGEAVTFPYHGTETTLYAKWGKDYKINSITFKDMSGNELSAITKGVFNASISLTNISSDEDVVLLLSQYSEDGRFKGFSYVNIGDMPKGYPMKFSWTVDNTENDLKTIKALVWNSFSSMMPAGDSVTYSER